jgi:CheY-like chemotaxis protein
MTMEMASSTTSHDHIVLVVEDDDDVRDAMTGILESKGYTVCSAQHGADALEHLRSGLIPCIILLDLMMPVMDGWAFCDSRRKSSALRDIPVIAISAVEIDESNRPADIDAFLAKPIDVDGFAGLAVRMAGVKPVRDRSIGQLH